MKIRQYQVPEEGPEFEALIRAFWRRIEPFKNDYGKELPTPLPVEFRAHMATALGTCEEINDEEDHQ